MKKALLVGGSVSDQETIQAARTMFLGAGLVDWSVDIYCYGEPYSRYIPAGTPNTASAPEGVAAYSRRDPYYLYADAVSYAQTEGYSLLIVVANEGIWANLLVLEEAVDAGICVVVPFSGSTAVYNGGGALNYPTSMTKLIAISVGHDENLSGYGEALEGYDSAGQSSDSIPLAVTKTGTRIAQILEENPAYSLWDARQHLRQASGGVWSLEEGYGKIGADTGTGEDFNPPLYASETLTVAAPLGVTAELSGDLQRITVKAVEFPSVGTVKEFRIKRSGTTLTLASGPSPLQWKASFSGIVSIQVCQVNKSGDEGELSPEFSFARIVKAEDIRASTINVSERNLAIQRKAAGKIINGIAKHKGFRTWVYKPRDLTPLHDDADINYKYEATADYEAFILIQGIEKLRYKTGQLLDNLAQDPVIAYFPAGSDVAKGYRLVVHLVNTDRIAFKVEFLLDQPSLDGEMYIRAHLSPDLEYGETAEASNVQLLGD